MNLSLIDAFGNLCKWSHLGQDVSGLNHVRIVRLIVVQQNQWEFTVYLLCRFCYFLGNKSVVKYWGRMHWFWPVGVYSPNDLSQISLSTQRLKKAPEKEKNSNFWRCPGLKWIVRLTIRMLNAWSVKIRNTRSKLFQKRTKDDKKCCQKIAKRIIELKFDWTLPEIFAIVNFGCLSL